MHIGFFQTDFILLKAICASFSPFVALPTLDPLSRISLSLILT